MNFNDTRDPYLSKSRKKQYNWKKNFWVFSTCSHPPGVSPITRDQDGNWKNPLIAPLGTSSGVIMPNFVFLPPVVLSGHIPGSKMRPSIF